MWEHQLGWHRNCLRIGNTLRNVMCTVLALVCPHLRSNFYWLHLVLWEILTRKEPYAGITGWSLPVMVAKGTRPEIPNYSNIQSPNNSLRLKSSISGSTDSLSSNSGASSSSCFSTQYSAEPAPPPDYIKLMKACWRPKSQKRPSFKDIHTRLCRIRLGVGNAKLKVLP